MKEEKKAYFKMIINCLHCTLRIFTPNSTSLLQTTVTSD